MTVYSAPAPGCYRRVRGVHILLEKDSGLAICDYPLRAVRLPIVAAQLLAYCDEERPGEELARHAHLSLKQVEVLCEQLCRRGLLEAGPALPPAVWPCVSIIIPTRNRAAQLERCLRSLLALDYPASALEIIVVDDASTDETPTMLQRFVAETAAYGWTIHVIRHATRRGVGKGRNTGAAAANSDLLAYIDSDCVASRGWLKELVPAFQDARLGAVGGLLRAYERTGMVGRYEDVRSSLFMGVRAQEVQAAGPIPYVPTANLLVRREAWRRLEGFASLNFGEDVDFCRRLLAAGYRARYLPHGTVYHDYRTRLRDFLRTRVSYASSEAILLRLHPRERRTLILPPEQATFAALSIVGLWNMLARPFGKRSSSHGRTNVDRPAGIRSIPVILAALLTLMGAYRRWRMAREQRVPLGALAVVRATLRAHLAYTYHLCRHLTRYYTLPLLLIGLLLPPLLPLALLPGAIVVGVDYVRLRPDMGLGEYTLCSLLDDCAYGVGVILGCVKHRTWKPLLPVIRWKTTRTASH
ncbi:MAG TPA: mycofactocin biosynthesis glycosyltransferase MftF [Ktedonobacteraceae bacterium]|nr:mycofactocin biosynthesis glycosyltransferase MftF [Ktedonobacteraceae bacterium]